MDKSEMLRVLAAQYKIHRKEFSRKQCNAPKWIKTKCDKIINAHTISKSQNLKNIAENGHVYFPKRDLHTWLQMDTIPLPRKTGINEASTFSGMCHRHDNDIFMPLENDEFIPTLQQAFLLYYRAMIYERHQKQAQIISGEKSIESIKIDDHARYLMIRDEMQAILFGARHCLGAMHTVVSKLERILRGHKYNLLKHLLVYFKGDFPVYTSCVLFPESTVDGYVFEERELSRKNLDFISINSFHSKDGDGIIFSWDPHNSPNAEVIAKSVFESTVETLPTKLLLYLFIFSENLAISPRWWEPLSQEEKERFASILMVEGSNFEMFRGALVNDDFYHLPDVEVGKICYI